MKGVNMSSPFKRRKSKTITLVKAAIVKFLVGKLGLYQHQAAALIGVNQGRISEIMTGKKFPRIKPADDVDPDQLNLGI